MQSTQTITDKVIAAISNVKHVPAEQVRPDSTLAELGLDSLDTINLLFELEETFHVSIPDEETRRVRTVRDIADGIQELTAKAAGGTGDHTA
ncbi:MAG: acyl carrier protein [Terriglobales bacterium]